AGLAAGESRWTSERFTLVTQNIDGLHHAAGSRNVLEIHGRLSRVVCCECGIVEDRPGEELPPLPRCAACQGLMRPGVVWFHEMLPPGVWLRAERASESCQCFLVVGTSAVVYPAALLVRWARNSGAAVIEVNLERTEASELADVTLLGPAGQVLPELVKRLGGGPGSAEASPPAPLPPPPPPPDRPP